MTAPRKRLVTYKTTWETNGVTYSTQNRFQDLDTGEIIARHKALNKQLYIKIKTQKNGTIWNEPRTKCTIFLVTLLRKNRQLELYPKGE